LDAGADVNAVKSESIWGGSFTSVTAFGIAVLVVSHIPKKSPHPISSSENPSGYR
jgi:hypothetical protein